MSKTYQPAQQPKPAPFENPKKGEVNELRMSIFLIFNSLFF